MAKRKNPYAVAMGYLSAARMTPEERTLRARKAARARWGTKPKKVKLSPPPEPISTPEAS